MLQIATAQLAGKRYRLGMFSSSGIYFIFLIDVLIYKSACKNATQATIWRIISEFTPLNRSLTKLFCYEK